VPKIKTTLKDPDIDYRLLDERGATEQRARRPMQSPIDYARSRGQITAIQHATGERIYAHWCFGFGPLVRSPDLDNVVTNFAGKDHAAKTESQEHHRRKLINAFDKVGDRRASVLRQAIIQEIPFVEIGRGLGWRDRERALGEALMAAREGLDILCREWGITST
jgi:hypothetical protein